VASPALFPGEEIPPQDEARAKQEQINRSIDPGLGFHDPGIPRSLRMMQRKKYVDHLIKIALQD